MAHNSTPLRFSSKNPWKIGDLFKDGDLSKSTPFHKAYQPYPPTSSCSHEAVRLEKTPQNMTMLKVYLWVHILISSILTHKTFVLYVEQ
jgi:hypothetical protein